MTKKKYIFLSILNIIGFVGGIIIFWFLNSHGFKGNWFYALIGANTCFCLYDFAHDTDEILTNGFLTKPLQ